MLTKPAPSATRPMAYASFVVFVAGLGGLLYGIDISIISAALLYAPIRACVLAQVKVTRKAPPAVRRRQFTPS